MTTPVPVTPAVAADHNRNIECEKVAMEQFFDQLATVNLVIAQYLALGNSQMALKEHQQIDHINEDAMAIFGTNFGDLLRPIEELVYSRSINLRCSEEGVERVDAALQQLRPFIMNFMKALHFENQSSITDPHFEETATNGFVALVNYINTAVGDIFDGRNSMDGPSLAEVIRKISVCSKDFADYMATQNFCPLRFSERCPPVNFLGATDTQHNTAISPTDFLKHNQDGGRSVVGDSYWVSCKPLPPGKQQQKDNINQGRENTNFGDSRDTQTTNRTNVPTRNQTNTPTNRTNVPTNRAGNVPTNQTDTNRAGNGNFTQQPVVLSDRSLQRMRVAAEPVQKSSGCALKHKLVVVDGVHQYAKKYHSSNTYHAKHSPTCTKTKDHLDVVVVGKKGKTSYRLMLPKDLEHSSKVYYQHSKVTFCVYVNVDTKKCKLLSIKKTPHQHKKHKILPNVIHKHDSNPRIVLMMFHENEEEKSKCRVAKQGVLVKPIDSRTFTVGCINKGKNLAEGQLPKRMVLFVRVPNKRGVRMVEIKGHQGTHKSDTATVRCNTDGGCLRSLTVNTHWRGKKY